MVWVGGGGGGGFEDLGFLDLIVLFCSPLD